MVPIPPPNPRLSGSYPARHPKVTVQREPRADYLGTGVHSLSTKGKFAATLGKHSRLAFCNFKKYTDLRQQKNLESTVACYSHGMSHRVVATIQSIMDAKGYSARELAWLGMGGGLLVGWKLTRYAICTIREILSQ